MPLRPVNVRMPEDLIDLAKAEAEQQGIGFSEFVRQALVARLAWAAAVRLVQAGLPPDEALDIEKVTRRLAQAGQGSEDA